MAKVFLHQNMAIMIIAVQSESAYLGNAAAAANGAASYGKPRDMLHLCRKGTQGNLAKRKITLTAKMPNAATTSHSAKVRRKIEDGASLPAYRDAGHLTDGRGKGIQQTYYSYKDRTTLAHDDAVRQQMSHGRAYKQSRKAAVAPAIHAAGRDSMANYISSVYGVPL